MTTVDPPYGDIWKVARVDESRLDADQRAELHAWVTSLGVEPKDVRPRFVVSQRSADGAFLLHLSRLVRDGSGVPFVDIAADRVHTEPLVIEVATFPDWLPAVGAEQETTGAP